MIGFYLFPRAGSNANFSFPALHNFYVYFPQHYYLILDGKRVESFGLFAKSIQRIHTPKKPLLATKGLVFELDIDRKTNQLLTKAFSKRTRDLSCLHFVCRVLESSNIHFSLADKTISGIVVATQLLQGKLTDANGQIIPMRTIATLPEEITNFILHTKEMDPYLKSQKQILVALSLTGGLVAYLIIDTLQDNQEKNRAMKKAFDSGNIKTKSSRILTD